MGAQAEASVFILSCLWRQPLPGHSRPSRRCCFPNPTLRPGPGELERGHSESLLQGEALCQVAVGSSVLGPPWPCSALPWSTVCSPNQHPGSLRLAVTWCQRGHLGSASEERSFHHLSVCSYLSSWLSSVSSSPFIHFYTWPAYAAARSFILFVPQTVQPGSNYFSPGASRNPLRTWHSALCICQLLLM